MTTRRTRMIGTAGAALALMLTAWAPGPAVAGHGGWDSDYPGTLHPVLDGLSGPRGLDALGHGKALITEGDGTFSLVVEGKRVWRGERHGSSGSTTKKIPLGQIETGFAPAISAGRDGTVWLLTGGGEPTDPTAARLYKWRWGWDDPVEVANIAAYQASDPDPYDLENLPKDSNPFGLAALADGSVLVADAAGNDLLRVSRYGDIETVARLMPREVVTPAGLPDAGKTVAAEAVATSVTVGKDGNWYVGELRGYPATPGTSQIWRIKPGTTDAVCDPEHPWGDCKRYADGLTSIVDLGAGYRGIYALTLSKMSWLAVESPTPIPGAEVGGLYVVSKNYGNHHRGRHGGTATITELVPGQLILPGGVDVAENPYVVGPIFPDPELGGSLQKID
ncbi:ScyD/ScyE family protein [Nocardioides caricicola]|uniref:ScyD/ScyE family protein n=1 Tax=Nocardioides caricicola TaxID=634770 RepID=A0ABW0N4L3_9ACTN